MNRLLTALVAAAALWIAACSSGGSTVQPPPPSGKFTLASLSGTYAFTTSGEVFSGNTVNPMARVGSFIADGKGGISGGVEDVNTAGSPSGAIAIAGGSYTVNADGRGTLTLNFQSGNSINFGIVLTSGSSGLSPATDGLMIDETSTTSQSSTGSGNFVKQDTTVCSSPVSSVAGTYVFDFSGLDASNPPAPESFVGEFTASNGVTTANLGDINDDFAISTGTFTATFGTDNLTAAGPNACGRGLAQFVTGTVTETYAYYVVDASRVRFINAAGGEMLSGDAVLQGNVAGSPSGGFAFIVAGASMSGGLTRVGRLSVASAAVNNILMDVNDAGTETQVNTLTNGASTYDPTTGRGTLSFQSSLATYKFVFYLSSQSGGVIQEQTLANNTPIVVADGSILAQTGSPFASSNITGPYALNWSGLSVQQGSIAIQDEEDLLAQASIKNLALSGTADIFQFTAVVPRTDFGLGGTITLGGDGTGRNTMTIDLNGASPIHMAVYIVSPQLAFFANSDNNGTPRIVAGVLKAQQ